MIKIKTFNDVYDSIGKLIEEKTGQKFRTGSVIDLYNTAIAEALVTIYQEIEDAKNPYLYSTLSGDNLDDLGILVNISREDGEDDRTYLYRLMNWLLTSEASNDTAIKNSLLNLTYASNVEYVPMSHGCGTGTFYVIPLTYTDETIANALKEVKEKVDKVSSTSFYKEYIIPKQKAVTLAILISLEEGDLDTIKTNLRSKILEYVNNIAPKSYLEIGEINKIGINEEYVDYFSVTGLYIDNTIVNKTKVIQSIDSKFLLDEIIWTEESGE